MTEPAGELRQGIDHLVRNVRHGRFEKAMSGLTAIGAVVTGMEIWLEHDRASFANRMMWAPVVLSPVVAAAGVAGVFSRRAAKTAVGRGRRSPGTAPRRGPASCPWPQSSRRSTAARRPMPPTSPNRSGANVGGPISAL